MSQPRTTSGRRALVTGASSGIGRAVAQVLAEAGYHVVLLARRAEALESVRDELPGTGHRCLPCDLCDPESIAGAFAALEGDGLDLLVNNAGIGYRARVEELEPSLLGQVFDTNVRGMLLTCKAALPLLRAGKRPVVVNIASVVGRRGIPGQAAYSASKAAVCSIGEALRVEWAEEGIAVCTLNPALTATGFFDAQANPAGLPHPDLEGAVPSESVARHVLELDQNPRREVSLRWKWRLLGMLSVLAPRLADRMLVSRLGGSWRAPRW